MPDNKKQTDEQLKKELSEQYALSKRYLDPIHERFNDQEELYRSYINPQNYPNKARVFDPRVFRVIETVTPRMVANEPTGSFYPQEEGDMGVAHILNALMKYDWRRAEMFPKLVSFVKSMLIFGTSFGRVYYDYRECEKTRMVPKDVEGQKVWSPVNNEKVKYTEFDGPNFEVLNIYDCFPDPNAYDIHSMRWFIYRRFKTIDELEEENSKKGGEFYKNLDKLREMVEAKDNNKQKGYKPSDLQFREHRRVMLSTEEMLGEDTSNMDIVILRRFDKDRWTDYCPEYDLILRDTENPYFHGELPIVYGTDYMYPGELYGMGEIEPVERIQRAINAVLNQRLDNVQMTLNTMWKVKKGGGVDMHTLISAPGNVVTTNDMGAVEPIQVPDVTGSTFVQTMNYLTASLQNGSGITDYTVGINTGANTVNDTATGTRLIQQEANAQFKLKIQLFTHMVIQRIANQWKDLRVQYTTEPQVLRIIGSEAIKYLKDNTKMATTSMDGQPIYPGEDTIGKLNLVDNNFAFLKLLPEDIQPSIVGDYDFIATVSSDMLTDPIALQQNFFTAIDRITNPNWIKMLEMQGKMPNAEELTGKVFEKLQLGIESKDAVIDIPKPPAPPQMGGDGQPIQEDPNAIPSTPLDPALQEEINSLQSPEAMQLAQNGQA